MRRTIINKDAILAVSVVLALYLIMFSAGITCPIKYITGVSCAGCGMTRAWISFLGGDVKRALSFHPLFPVPAFAAVLYILRDRIPKKCLRVTGIVICAAFIIVYIVRMCDPGDTVVVFEPGEGVIGRLMRMERICNF